MDANVIVILVSLALFLAYVSGVIFTHTGVPDTVWLIGFGVLFGPVMNLFNADLLRPMAPILVLMALNLLMFEAGMNLDLKTFKETMRKSSALAACTFLLTTASVGYLLHYIMPQYFNYTQALLFGAMIGGTSTSTVLGILGSMQRYSSNIGDTRRFLVLESIVSDSLCIVTAMTLMRIILSPSIPLNDGIKDIVFVFTVSIFIGFCVGVLWVQILDLVKNRPFNYIMTIAALFVAYIVSEEMGGPGAGSIAALAFGITLTNYPLLAKRFGLRENVRVEMRRLRSFHEEITFLVKSFLFLFVGLEITLNAEYLFLGLGITALIGAVRVVSVYITDSIVDISDLEVRVSRLIFSNGLTALVISQLPLVIEMPHMYFPDPKIYVDLAVPIVMATSMFGSLFGPLFLGKKAAPEAKPEPATG
ncbi:MAG: cation:proton antiporter [Candidatus Bathyarchaeota archaeon]